MMSDTPHHLFSLAQPKYAVTHSEREVKKKKRIENNNTPNQLHGITPIHSSTPSSLCMPYKEGGKATSTSNRDREVSTLRGARDKGKKGGTKK